MVHDFSRFSLSDMSTRTRLLGPERFNINIWSPAAAQYESPKEYTYTICMLYLGGGLLRFGHLRTMIRSPAGAQIESPKDTWVVD